MTRTGAPIGPSIPNTRPAIAPCTSRTVSAGDASARPPSSPKALTSAASIARLLVATHRHRVARESYRSDGPQVAHVDLVRRVARAERTGRVPHDVVGVEAHARVAAAARHRHRLLLHRLHERQV